MLRNLSYNPKLPSSQHSTYKKIVPPIFWKVSIQLHAFACINHASATLPRSKVNKDASMEVLLGPSQSKGSIKLPKTTASSMKHWQPAKNLLKSNLL